MKSILNFFPANAKSNISVFKRLNGAVFFLWCVSLLASFSYIKSLQGRLFDDADISAGPGNNDELSVKEEKTVEGKPFSYYDDIIKKRSLFKGIALPQEKKNKKTLSQTASELLANYSLKGILSEDSPQAIIEDKKTKQTFFLNKGDSLGEFLIEEINEGKITLDLEGQKVEMSL